MKKNSGHISFSRNMSAANLALSEEDLSGNMHGRGSVCESEPRETASNIFVGHKEIPAQSSPIVLYHYDFRSLVYREIRGCEPF